MVTKVIFCPTMASSGKITIFTVAFKNAFLYDVLSELRPSISSRSGRLIKSIEIQQYNKPLLVCLQSQRKTVKVRRSVLQISRDVLSPPRYSVSGE